MTNAKTSKSMTVTLVQTALLAAIIVVMAFTPLGYLKIGPLSMTLLILPVALGASISGIASGAILGTVFGVTSFIQCLGTDALGTIAFGISPLFCFIMCIVTRAIAGFAAGLVSNMLKNGKFQSLRFLLTALTASLLNSVLFLGSMYFLFADKMMENPDFKSMLADNDAAGMTFFAFIIAPSIVNVIAEACANTIFATLIMTALTKSRIIKVKAA